MAYGKMSDEKLALGLTRFQLNPGTPEDNAKYSEIVYRSGGKYRGGADGGSYSCKGVSSEDELEEALEAGWFRTPGEALKTVPTEAEDIRAELKKLKDEKLLDTDREELVELRKEKAEREEKNARAKAIREEKKRQHPPELPKAS